MRESRRYRAVLNPRDFDNDRFWRLVYAAGLEHYVLTSAQAAGFTDVIHHAPLSFEGRSTVYVPNIEAFLSELRLRAAGFQYHYTSDILSESLTGRGLSIGQLIDHLSATHPAFYFSHSLVDAGMDDSDILGTRHFIPTSSGSSSPPQPLASISWMILGGFMMALGVVAVVVALTVLNAATLGGTGLVVAGVGVASLLAGEGLFRRGTLSSNPPPSAPTPIPVMREMG